MESCRSPACPLTLQIRKRPGSGWRRLCGLGGQALAVIPSKRLVVAQTADRSDSPAEIRASHLFELLRLIVAASPKE